MYDSTVIGYPLKHNSRIIGPFEGVIKKYNPMTFILHAVTQQPSSPQQQPAGVQHQLLSSATGHQPQFGNLLIILRLTNTCANLYYWSTRYDHAC